MSRVATLSLALRTIVAAAMVSCLGWGCGDDVDMERGDPDEPGGDQDFSLGSMVVGHTPPYKLTATIFVEGTPYAQSSWPWQFSEPVFLWQQLKPYSDGEYRVHYDGNAVNEWAEGLYYWEWEPDTLHWGEITISGGTLAYRATAEFEDDVGAPWLCPSPDGIRTTRVTREGSFGTPITRAASSYIYVPYVLGVVQDALGDSVGKTLHGGYCGLDCSGLAAWAYVRGAGENLNLNYANCVNLIACYGNKGLTFDDRQSDYMLFANPGGSNHVGICMEGDKIVHANATTMDTKLEPISFRPYWWLSFLDIGCLPADPGCPLID